MEKVSTMQWNVEASAIADAQQSRPFMEHKKIYLTGSSEDISALMVTRKHYGQTYVTAAPEFFLSVEYFVTSDNHIIVECIGLRCGPQDAPWILIYRSDQHGQYNQCGQVFTYLQDCDDICAAISAYESK